MGVPLPMADDDNEPDDTPLYEYETHEAVCLCCGQPAYDAFADDDRYPWCGRATCEGWMRAKRYQQGDD